MLACGSIWDVMYNQQFATFVSNKISSNILQDIVSQLLDECLKLEAMNNISIYIVKLQTFQKIY
jgi:serine/threonine protein phosphatase PrpC